MDPPALMNEAGSYNLAEIWPFPINAAGDSGSGGLGLRRPHFGSGSGSGQFGDGSGNDPMNVDHRVGSGGVSAPAPARKRRDVDEDSAMGVSTSSGATGLNDCDGKRIKSSGYEDESRESKAEAGPASGKDSRPPDPPKQDYIHVRARRGQATDSHSLAERARREKISERMKILQDLVPGCNKVIGKALVLDEIINYIQSLQRQVEFLSMKLEAVNARMPSGIDVFPSKDINLASQFGQQNFEAAGMAFASQPPRDFSRPSSPDWLHMQVGGGFERTT